jgi:LysM repeat protein
MLRARRRGGESSKRSLGSWFRRQQVLAGALLAAVGVAVVLRVKASTDNEARQAGLPVVDISATDQSTIVPTSAASSQRATAAAEATSTPPAYPTAEPETQAQATPQPKTEATAQTVIEATPLPESESTPHTEAASTTQMNSEATVQPGTEAQPIVETAEDSALMQPAPPPPPPPPRARTSQQPVGYRTYTVQRGDILKQIAARYGVSMTSIMAINTIPNPDSLRIGQVLTIPPPGS